MCRKSRASLAIRTVDEAVNKQQDCWCTRRISSNMRWADPIHFCSRCKNAILPVARYCGNGSIRPCGRLVRGIVCPKERGAELSTQNSARYEFRSSPRVRDPSYYCCVVHDNCRNMVCALFAFCMVRGFARISSVQPDPADPPVPRGRDGCPGTRSSGPPVSAATAGSRPRSPPASRHPWPGRSP
jgi:hypothetical protein